MQNEFNFKDIDDFFTNESISLIDYKKDLNEEQYEAVINTEGPMLIIAGAGTGKTKTLTARVVWLIEKGIALPGNILLLTFTNKAAREMMSRAKSMLDDRCDEITGCTYHSFCAETIRKYANFVGLNNDFTICDPSDAADTINLVKEKKGYRKEKDFPKGKELVSIYSAALNKNETIETIVSQKYQKYIDYMPEINQLYCDYVAYKFEKSILDYDDLISYTNKLLTENETIRKRMSDLYHYIMVDEYQDSNLAQLQLLKLLRSFENQNICVVGDEQQSIYRFRGANFKNIIQFPEQFKPCKIIILNKNYRSNQEILDLSNKITELAIEKYDKNLTGTHHKGTKPNLVFVKNNFDEARFVLYQIIKQKNEGIPLSEMAVLIKGSADSGALETLIAQNMKEHKLEYKKFGGIRFMEKPFIKDIFAFLKLIINPADEISWFRIFQLYQNIGVVYAKKLTENIVDNGIEALLSKQYEKKVYGHQLPGIHEFFTKTQSIALQEQIEYLINDYYPGISKENIKNMKSTESIKKEKLKELEINISSAQLLIELAKDYKSASSFVNDLMLEAPEDGKDIHDYLTISTIHSAKGLEFHTVFILSVVDGSFPWAKNLPENNMESEEYFEEIEEERRVFYVAITRAKEDLFLMYPKVVMKYGKIENSNLSMFLKEQNLYQKYMNIIRQD